MSDNKFMEPEFSPIPPPIPPVVGVPGGNVQEQMGYLANKTNECIQRWNQIQAKCYEAMNKAVGAAVSNDVYYEPDEVHFCTGYSENDSAAYEYVEIKPVDRAGNPIKVNLALAYNNTSNSQVVQSIEDVSFLLNSNAIITAVSPDVGGWQGTSMQAGNPIATAEVSDSYVAGFNKNGALRVFASDVDLTVLYQNQMQDVIGPVTPIIIDGSITEQAQAMTTPASITAIGYKSSNGMKVFFSVGAQENPGMQGVTVAQILQSMGCTTAVITSCLENTGIVADHQTNGMEYMAKISNAPLGWQMPYNCAFWQVSKRPEPGWKNKFTSEIANLVQLYGQTSNDVEAIQNEIDIANANIAALALRMTAAESKLDEHDAKLDELDSRLTVAEADIDDLDARLEEAIATLTQAIEQETTDRVAADENLQSQITQLDYSLQQEVADRTAEDANLQIAINDEAIERANADLELSRQIADEVANRTEGDQILQDQITAMVNGSTTLPYVRRAGDTMSGDLYMNGNLIHTVGDAVESGDAVNLGQLEEVDDKVQSILDGTAEIGYVKRSGDTMSGALDMGDNKITSLADGTANGDAVNFGQLDAVENALQEQIDDILDGTTPVPGQHDYSGGDGIDISDSDVISVDDTVARQSDIDDLESQIEDILDGTTPVPSSYELPIASATSLGGIKVGANLSITDDGTLNAVDPGGGGTYIGGDGITISGETVSVDDTVARTSDITALESDINELETTVADLESDVTDLAGKVTTAESDIDTLETSVSGLESSKADVTALDDYLPLAGGTMSGAIDMGDTEITNVRRFLRLTSYSAAALDLYNNAVTFHVGSNAYTPSFTSSGTLNGITDGTEDDDAATVGQLNTVESGLQGQIDNITSGATELPYASSDDLDALEDRVEQAETDIDNLESSVSSLQTEVDGKADASALANYVAKSGDTMSGTLSMGSNKITNVADGSDTNDAVNYGQLEVLQELVESSVIDFSSWFPSDPTLYAMLPVGTTGYLVQYSGSYSQRGTFTVTYNSPTFFMLTINVTNTISYSSPSSSTIYSAYLFTSNVTSSSTRPNWRVGCISNKYWDLSSATNFTYLEYLRTQQSMTNAPFVTDISSPGANPIYYYSSSSTEAGTTFYLFGDSALIWERQS